MDPIENLRTLHGEEEKVRVQSLTTIEQRADLRDHLAIIAEAMNLIWAFSRDHAHESDDELTMQLLGIRLFNAAAVSIKLALSGYYQKGFVHLRDVIETGSLIDYLTTHPDKIPEWKAADKKTRKNVFGPHAIRKALDERDQYTGEKRKAIYDLISEAATHASYRGFGLVLNADKLGEIGPFFDEKKLIVWLQDLAKHLPMVAAQLVPVQAGDLKLLATSDHFIAAWRTWAAKYFRVVIPS
jgi:hypothetical protein